MSAAPVMNTSRRDFLQASGALVVCATGWLPQVAQTQTLTKAGATKPALAATELDSWVAISPDGKVTAYFGKVDLGQGLEVAIGQIVAEELDVAFAQVKVEMGNTATSLNQGGASSALGIQAGAKPLRNAAAEARRILLDMASQRLQVPVERLQIDQGIVKVSDDASKMVSYAELIGGGYFQAKVQWNQKIGNALEIKGTATPKRPDQYRVVGQSIARSDVAAKVFGKGMHVSEVRVPGMLHARVIRNPIAGGKPLQVDAKSIAHIRGARVIQEKDFLAVVAEKEWDAVRAAQQLKVKWTKPSKAFGSHQTVHAHLRSAPILKRDDSEKSGDVTTAFASAARVVEAEYLWPFQSHASMGPACAVVDARPDQVTLWTGSQKPHFARDGVAKLLGISVDKVHGIWVIGPGSYGRNDAGDAALDAALLSKLTGRPVRVQGMRHDATAWDPKAPASVHRARAAIDATGKVTAFEFVSRGFSRVNIESNESDPRDSLVGMQLGMEPNPGIGFGTPAQSYGFENKLLAWEVVAPLQERASPLRTSHMRDPVGLQIHFASEQFIDEIAFATNIDPLAFRLANLKAPRDRAVVAAAAEKANWKVGPSFKQTQTGGVLKGRGLAYAQRGGTIVALVIDVEVNVATGRIWPRQLSVAHDCGLVVNPQGLRATIENGVTQALSRALFEEVQFEPERVTSVDWNTYPILSTLDAPERIEVVLINRPELPPTGAGEASSRIVAAALANAFFDATGVRLRQVPLTPARVLAALATRKSA